MHFLIGLFVIHLCSGFSYGWEFKRPEFIPQWIGHKSISEVYRLKKDLKKNPSNTQILTTIGYLYVIRGQLKESRRYLRLASDKGANDSFFFLSKGLLHSSLQENTVAENLLFKALVINEQEDPQYFFHFAEHLFRVGKISKSIHWLQLGLKLHPSQPHLLILLALNYISNSNWNKAEISLIKARQLSPEFDQYLSFNLAKIYAIIQDWDSSIYNLRRATLKGYRNYHRIKSDKVFNPIRNHPQFVLLLKQAEQNNQKFLNLYRFNKI